MEYISIKTASELWGIDPSNIGKLCRKGKIEGAKIVGRNWLIPKNAAKPIDGRTKQAKEDITATVFRFPLFVNFPENGFAPPLAAEEAKLCQAQTDFYACDFQKSQAVLEELAEDAQSIYVKICARFYMCVLCAVFNRHISWEKHYLGINLLLSTDFPHKKEMDLFLPWLDFITGQFNRIPDRLNCEDAYELHPSAWYLNTFLSALNFSGEHTATINKNCTEPFVTLCRLMERDGYYVEAQELHLTLFMYCHGGMNKEAMYFHLKKAVHLAYEHRLLFAIADIVSYYSYEVNKVLSDYPDSFNKTIQKNGKIIYDNFSRFAEENQKTDMYARLSKNDYPYIFYAFNGFPNKKVAQILHISERTVAMRYNEIYLKLGITGKHELLNEMSSAFGNIR